MQIGSALNSGYLGLQKASQQVDESSARLAQLSTQPDQVDPTTELVSLKVAEQGGQVAAEVVKTADEMMGTLLDIRV
ncbi:MAG: flagellar biosynthesis protein FlgE [Aeromonadaceae bacterium]|nr:flagellar biosynthesis protein FlgE [Aeromonadaceae bacterium]